MTRKFIILLVIITLIEGAGIGNVHALIPRYLLQSYEMDDNKVPQDKDNTFAWIQKMQVNLKQSGIPKKRITICTKLLEKVLEKESWKALGYVRKIEILKEVFEGEFKKAIGYEDANGNELEDAVYGEWLKWYMKNVLGLTHDQLSTITQEKIEKINKTQISQICRGYLLQKGGNITLYRKRLTPILLGEEIKKNSWNEEVLEGYQEKCGVDEEVIVCYRKKLIVKLEEYKGKDLTYEDKIDILKEVFEEAFKKVIGYEDVNGQAISDDEYGKWLRWYVEEVLGVSRKELSAMTQEKTVRVGTGTISAIYTGQLLKNGYPLRTYRTRFEPILFGEEIKKQTWREELFEKYEARGEVDEKAIAQYRKILEEKVKEGAWFKIPYDKKIEILKEVFKDAFKKAIGYEDVDGETLSDEEYGNWLRWYVEKILDLSGQELSKITQEKTWKVDVGVISSMYTGRRIKLGYSYLKYRNRLEPILLGEGITMWRDRLLERYKNTHATGESIKRKIWIEELLEKYKVMHEVEVKTIAQYRVKLQDKIKENDWQKLSYDKKIKILKDVFEDQFEKAIGYKGKNGEKIKDEEYGNWLRWYVEEGLALSGPELSKITEENVEKVSAIIISGIYTGRLLKRGYSLTTYRNRLEPILLGKEIKTWIEELFERYKTVHELDETTIAHYRIQLETKVQENDWGKLSYDKRIEILKEVFEGEFKKAIGCEDKNEQALSDEEYGNWLKWYVEDVLGLSPKELSDITEEKMEKIYLDKIYKIYYGRFLQQGVSITAYRKRLEPILLGKKIITWKEQLLEGYKNTHGIEEERINEYRNKLDTQLKEQNWEKLFYAKRIKILQEVFEGEFKKAIGYKGKNGIALSDEEYGNWLKWYMHKVLQLGPKALSDITQEKTKKISDGIISGMYTGKLLERGQPFATYRKRLEPILLGEEIKRKTWIEELFERYQSMCEISETRIIQYRINLETKLKGKDWKVLLYDEKIELLKEVFGDEFRKAIGYEEKNGKAIRDEEYGNWMKFYMETVLWLDKKELEEITDKKFIKVHCNKIGCICVSDLEQKKKNKINISFYRKRLDPVLLGMAIKTWKEKLLEKYKAAHEIGAETISQYRDKLNASLKGKNWRKLVYDKKIEILKEVFEEEFVKAIGYKDKDGVVIKDEDYGDWLRWYVEEVLGLKTIQLSDITNEKTEKINASGISAIYTSSYLQRGAPITSYRNRLRPILLGEEIKPWEEILLERYKTMNEVERERIEQFRRKLKAKINANDWEKLSYDKKVEILKNVFEEEFEKAIGYKDKNGKILSDKEYGVWVKWYIEDVLGLNPKELSAITDDKVERIPVSNITKIFSGYLVKQGVSIITYRKRLKPILLGKEIKTWDEKFLERYKIAHEVNDVSITQYRIKLETKIKENNWNKLSYAKRIEILKEVFEGEFKKAIGYEDKNGQAIRDEEYGDWLKWYVEKVLEVSGRELSRLTKEKTKEVNTSVISGVYSGKLIKTGRSIAIYRKRLDPIVLDEAAPSSRLDYYNLDSNPTSVFILEEELEEFSESMNHYSSFSVAHTVIDDIHSIKTEGVEAVVFDLDDTLVQYKGYTGSSTWESDMHAMGIDENRVYRECSSHHRYQIAHDCFEPTGEKITEYICTLQSQGITIHVITSRSSITQVKKILHSLDLDFLQDQVICAGSVHEKIARMQKTASCYAPGKVICVDNDIRVLDKMRDDGMYHVACYLMNAKQKFKEGNNFKVPDVKTENPLDLIDLLQMQRLQRVTLSQEDLFQVSRTSQKLLENYRIKKTNTPSDIALRGALYCSLVRVLSDAIYQSDPSEISRELLLEFSRVLFHGKDESVHEEFATKYREGKLKLEKELNENNQARGRDYILEENQSNESFFVKDLLTQAYQSDVIIIPLRGAVVYGWLLEEVNARFSRNSFNAFLPEIVYVPLSVKNKGDGLVDVVGYVKKHGIDLQGKSISIIDDNISQGATTRILSTVCRMNQASSINVYSPMLYRDKELYDLGEGVSIDCLLSPEGSYYMKGVNKQLPWRPPVTIQTRWEREEHLTGYDPSRVYLGELELLTEGKLYDEYISFRKTAVDQFFNDVSLSSFQKELPKNKNQELQTLLPWDTYSHSLLKKYLKNRDLISSISFPKKYPYEVKEVTDITLFQELIVAGYLGDIARTIDLIARNKVYVLFNEKGERVGVIVGRTVQKGVTVIEYVHMNTPAADLPESMELLFSPLVKGKNTVLCKAPHYFLSDSRLLRGYFQDTLMDPVQKGSLFGTLVKLYEVEGLEGGAYYGVVSSRSVSELEGKTMRGYERRFAVGVEIAQRISAKVSSAQKRYMDRLLQRKGFSALDELGKIQQQVSELIHLFQMGIITSWPSWFFSEQHYGEKRVEEAIRQLVVNGYCRISERGEVSQEDLFSWPLQTPIRHYLLEEDLGNVSVRVLSLLGIERLLQEDEDVLIFKGLPEVIIHKGSLYQGAVTHREYSIETSLLQGAICDKSSEKSIELTQGAISIEVEIHENKVMQNNQEIGMLQKQLEPYLKDAGTITLELIYAESFGMLIRVQGQSELFGMLNGKLYTSTNINEFHVMSYLKTPLRKKLLSLSSSVEIAVAEDENAVYMNICGDQIKLCEKVTGLITPSQVRITQEGRLEVVGESSEYYKELCSQYSVNNDVGIHNRKAYVWIQSILRGHAQLYSRVLLPELSINDKGRLHVVNGNSSNPILLGEGFQKLKSVQGVIAQTVYSSSDSSVYVVLENIHGKNREYAELVRVDENTTHLKWMTTSIATESELQELLSYCNHNYPDLLNLVTTEGLLKTLVRRHVESSGLIFDSAIDWTVDELLARYWHPTIALEKANLGNVARDLLGEYEQLYYERLDEAYNNSFSLRDVETEIAQIKDRKMRDHLSKRIQSISKISENLKSVVKEEFHLRLFQLLSIQRMQTIWEKHQGTQISVTTGGGKTLIGLTGIIEHILSQKSNYEYQVIISAKNSALDSVWGFQIMEFLQEAKQVKENDNQYEVMLPGNRLIRFTLVNHNAENLMKCQGLCDYLVLDESHVFVDGESNRYKALQDIIAASPGIKTLLLSATPYQGEHIEKYASQYSLLSNKHSFSQIQSSLQEVSSKDKGLSDWIYRNITREYVVVYTKDVLPDYYFSKLEIDDAACQLTPNVVTAYKEAVDHEKLLYSSILHELHEINELYSEPKLQKIEDFMEGENVGNNKVIIYTSYRSVASMLKNRFLKYGAELIQGGIGRDKTMKNLAKFSEDESCRILIITPVGLTSLNIGDAESLFVFDPPSSHIEQLFGRFIRLEVNGKSKISAHAYLLSFGQTLEQKIYERLDRQMKKSRKYLSLEKHLCKAA